MERTNEGILDPMQSAMVSRQRLDYQMLLLMHLGRFSALSSFEPKIMEMSMGTNYKPVLPDVLIKFQRQQQKDSMSICIDVVEMLVAAMLDEEYNTALTELDKQYKNKDTDIKYVLSKGTLLIKLLSRCGLLLISEEDEHI